MRGCLLLNNLMDFNSIELSVLLTAKASTEVQGHALFFIIKSACCSDADLFLIQTF